MDLQGFRRSADEKMLGGLSQPIADALGTTAGTVRLLLVALALFSGSGVFWAYLLLWAFVPQEGSGRVMGRELFTQAKQAAEQRAGDRRPSGAPRVNPADLRSQPYPWESDHITPKG